ncbi:hypothetical protein [Lyngbya aestuarii]|uniref:hypothetical protein n=1 Tax=Lyngbya aestuarii TaxID=118322 RepID=UPI00403DA17D
MNRYSHMMREFLETYIQAINLDDKQYDCYFPNGVGRADFLLFEKQVVCEFKETQKINVSSKIEKISRRKDLSEQDLKRDLYNSIEKALSKANQQIQDTKQVFDIPNAFGLIIIENTMPKDLSILSLLDSANRKMIGGLVNTDCVLCVDFINTFSNPEGRLFRPVQILSRNTKQAKNLSNFINQLVKDFCVKSETPLLTDWTIEKASQVWFTDANGKYKAYTAKVDFKLPVSLKKDSWKQRVSHFLDRWWWVIPLPFICYDCYDWFVR